MVKKHISDNLIMQYVSPESLAYWIMCDGSLQKDKRSMIIHTQSYSEQDNHKICSELNAKFNFHSKVITHKYKYFVVLIPSQDSE